MRHTPVTMRDWLASLPEDDLSSVVEVIPALRRARNGSDDLRARIREFTDQQVEGLAHAFLAGVAQRLRSDGVPDQEIDEPDLDQLRSILDQLPPAHGRLALHALLIGSGPAATALPPALRSAADAVAAGTLPVDAELTAATLTRFAGEMTELAKQLGSLLGDEPMPSGLDGVQAHLGRVAEEERAAAERAVVREHREGISATIAKLEADGGPAFLVESYRTMLAEIDRELGPDVVTLPQTAPEARALLAGIGVDDELLAVLRPWPELCEPGEYIPRDDVSAVVAAEASEVPDLLRRLDGLGVLRENETGELALDEVTLRCLMLLPVEESASPAR